MSTATRIRYTPQEYLAREANSLQRHEYYQGEMYVVAGAYSAHNTIAENIFGNLFEQLRGRDCRPKASNVLVNADSLYAYPDASVICPPIEREPAPIETILNPRVIIEVLSPTTERYDRNVKLPRYQRTTSVREILLVQQDAALVERYARNDDGIWEFSRTEGLSGEVELTSIDCQLPMAEIFAGVEFPPSPFGIVLE